MLLGQMLSEVSAINAWIDERLDAMYEGRSSLTDNARISRLERELRVAYDELPTLVPFRRNGPDSAGNGQILDTLGTCAIEIIMLIQHFTGDASYTGNVLVDTVRKYQHRMHEVESAE
jgi:hypothetical protein